MLGWLNPGAGWAQPVATYTFAASAGTFTPLTAGTAVAAIQSDDAISGAIPLGFSFQLEGTAYTQVFASSNGILSFNSQANSAIFNELSSALADDLPLLAPLWDDLDGSSGTAAYQTTGSAPNRVFVFEWLNWKWQYSASAPGVSFQVRLREGTNRIEFVYRPEAGALNSPSASVGLASTSSFLSLNSLGPAPTASSTTETDDIAAKPAAGQTYSFSPPAGCTGAPTAGTLAASAPTLCAGGTTTLTLTGTSTNSGLSLQVQGSTNGVTFSNIAGATSVPYVATPPSLPFFYRVLVTCTNSGQSSLSNVVQVAAAAVPTYAALPYSQGFETTWLSRCNTRDAPDAHWLATPGSGDASWRRDDDGAAAGWTSGSGSYSPASSPLGGATGSHSACFHSYDAPFGAIGTLDLYANLSGGTGTPTLTFDYVNSSGTDGLAVLLSTNGGATFAATPLLNLVVAAGWARQTVTLAGATATTVIRFQATSDFGTTDIGLDNVQLSYVTCPAVTGLTATVSSSTTATLAFTPAAGATGYTLTLTPQGGTAVTLPATGSPVPLTGLIPTTTYTVTLTTNCGSSTSTAATATFTTPPANDLCAAAAALPVNTACATTTGTTVGATASPTGTPDPSCAGSVFNDVWYAVVVPPNGVVQVETSAAPGSLLTDTGLALYGGTCAALTGLGCDDDSGTGAFSLLRVTGQTPGATLYVRVWEYGGGDGGAFNICATTDPPCPAVTGLVVPTTGLTATSAQLTFVAPGNATGFVVTVTPQGGTATTVTPNPTSSPVTLTGLTPNTQYTVTVATTCGGLTSPSATATFTTPPLPPVNDLCSAATTFSACGQLLLGTTLGATSSGDPTVTCTANPATTGGVFYRFTPAVSGVYVASTCQPATNFDTQLFVYSGSCGNFTCVAGNDDDSNCSASTRSSTVSFAATAGTAYYLFVNGFSFYGNFALSLACARPLPVELARFEAGRKGSDASLSWSTASEQNSRGFQVQVAKDSTQQFRTLAFVASASPNSAQPRSYAYLDREAGKTGRRYYRLAQLDLDGSVSYSPVRSVSFDGPVAGAGVAVVPNPVLPGAPVVLRVQTPTAQTNAVRLWVTDAAGRTLRQQQLPALPAGQSLQEFSGLAAGLPAGIYGLHLQLDQQVLHTKFSQQ